MIERKGWQLSVQPLFLFTPSSSSYSLSHSLSSRGALLDVAFFIGDFRIPFLLSLFFCHCSIKNSSSSLTESKIIQLKIARNHTVQENRRINKRGITFNLDTMVSATFFFIFFYFFSYLLLQGVPPSKESLFYVLPGIHLSNLRDTSCQMQSHPLTWP